MPTSSLKSIAGGVAVLLGVAAPWLLSGLRSQPARPLPRAVADRRWAWCCCGARAACCSLGQGVFFGLGGYVLAMHLKLGGAAARANMPDFMMWIGRRPRCPGGGRRSRSPIVALDRRVRRAGRRSPRCSRWLVFRRRIGGVYFALITQALALAFATLLISQQGTTGGFNGLTDFKTLFGFDLNDRRRDPTASTG